MSENTSASRECIVQLVQSLGQSKQHSIVEFLLDSWQRREPLSADLLVELAVAQLGLAKYYEAWNSASQALEIDSSNTSAQQIVADIERSARRYRINGETRTVGIVQADEFIRANSHRGQSSFLVDLQMAEGVRPFFMHRLYDVLVVGGEGSIFDPATASIFSNSFASRRHTSVDYKVIQPSLSLDTTQTLRLSGEVAHLCGQWSGNFFHWVNECLPRVQMLRKSGFDGWYLVPTANHPLIRESLDVLGVPAERIVVQPPSAVVSCEKLVCFDSFWFWDFFTSPHLLAELRDALLEGMDRSVKLPDGAQGLYIRRAGKRAVANDQEVTELLESYGIVPFAAEYMTFRQQVALAAQSRCIVGPHGAGLTLSLFMPDDSKLVELLPIGSLTECFGHIVSLLNLRYYSVPSVPKHPERESERVEPCLGILERTLLQEFGKRPVKSLATSAPQADEVEVGRMV